MNNKFVFSNLYRENLNNGRKISNITFVMNPFREPATRINHFKYLFEEKNLINGRGVRNDKEYIISNQNPKKGEYSYHRKVKENQIPNFFENLCKRRIRDIYNKNGVIISRHFRVININSKEFPEERRRGISSALIVSKINNSRSKNKSIDTVKDSYNPFFSTELNGFDKNGVISPIYQKENKFHTFYIKGNKYREGVERNDIQKEFSTQNKNRNFTPIIKKGLEICSNTNNNNYLKLKEGLTKTRNDFSGNNKKNFLSKTRTTKFNNYY